MKMSLSNIGGSFLRVFRLLRQGRVYAQLKLHASALTFNTLLAIVPFLALTLYAFHAVGGTALLNDQAETFLFNRFSAAPQVQHMLLDVVHGFVEKLQTGKIGFVSTLLLMVSVWGIVQHIQTAFNSIFHQPHALKPLHQRVLLYLATLVWFPLLALVSLAIHAVLQSSWVFAVFNIVGASSAWLLQSIPFSLTFLTFAMMYRTVPAVPVRISSAWPAAGVTTVLWTTASWAYTYYTQHAFALRDLYGSLAALPLFLLWVYFSWLIVLFGAHLTFAFERIKS
jgi:membrane protein